jgi:hypothetical protein
VVGNSRRFLAAHFRIAKMAQKLETEIAIKFCRKSESFAIALACSY